ncbi:MAG TPA: extracellular solute-binding protein [Caldilineae bacterium]|nr:extracellular solute-binding protein [Caldilineae bacterium]
MLHIIGPNDPALDALDEALARRPELNAQLHIIPWPEYRDALMAGLTAEVSPWQAAFIPGHIWLPELAHRGLLAPLTPIAAALPEEIRGSYDAGDIIPSVAQECRYQDEDYLLPLFTDGHILFYLDSCFEFEEEVPVISTRDLLDLACKAHHPPKHAGIALKADASEIFTDWLPYLWEAGGCIFDESGQPDLTHPANLTALETYLALRAYAPPQTHRFGNAEIADVIRRGEAALVATWGGQAAPLFLDADLSLPPYRAAIFPTPWNATWGVGIPANQPHGVQREILAALMQAMGPDTDAAVIRTAGSPVRERSYTPDAMARYPWLAAQRAMLDRARPLPADPRLGRFLGDLYAFVHRAFVGEMSPRQALEAVQERALIAIHAVE